MKYKLVLILVLTVAFASFQICFGAQNPDEDIVSQLQFISADTHFDDRDEFLLLSGLCHSSIDVRRAAIIAAGNSACLMNDSQARLFYHMCAKVIEHLWQDIKSPRDRLIQHLLCASTVAEILYCHSIVSPREFAELQNEYAELVSLTLRNSIDDTAYSKILRFVLPGIKDTSLFSTFFPEFLDILKGKDDSVKIDFLLALEGLYNEAGDVRTRIALQIWLQDNHDLLTQLSESFGQADHDPRRATVLRFLLSVIAQP